MHSALSQQIFTGWTIRRWIILLFGFALSYSWFFDGGPITGLMAIYVLYQALLGTGCLVGRCPVPYDENQPPSAEKHELEGARVRSTP
ncbi:MAG: hypothetical protein ACNA78_07430 [Balneolaceae bacterium]